MATRDALDDLHRWIAERRRFFVLTGAGCSTESGIPDYRGEHGLEAPAAGVCSRRSALKKRPPSLLGARYAGWPRFSAAEPNAAHHALAAWERAGSLARLVTQNVDGLHQRAGSPR